MEKMKSETNPLGLEIPAVVAGLPIDWRKYEPPGGNEFVERWSEIYPRLKAQAEEELRKAEDKATARMTGLRKMAKAAEMILAARELMESARADLGDDATEMMNALATADTPHLRDLSRELLAKERADSARREADTAFNKAFMAFMELDREADMEMFAFIEAEDKYKAKILRSLIRHLNEIDNIRQTVFNSDCDAKRNAEGLDLYRYALSLMQKYDEVIPVWRAVKKLHDRTGSFTSIALKSVPMVAKAAAQA